MFDDDIYLLIPFYLIVFFVSNSYLTYPITPATPLISPASPLISPASPLISPAAPLISPAAPLIFIIFLNIISMPLKASINLLTPL